MATRTLRGVHVFWMVAAFFAVTVGVEVLFVVRAVGTFPGEDAPNSYVQGLDYNKTLARRSEQKKLGWQAEAGVNRDSILIVRMHGSGNEPLRNLEISAAVRRVGQSFDGKPTQLSERAPGEYIVPLGPTGAGRLRIEIEARRPGEAQPVFEASKTVVIE